MKKATHALIFVLISLLLFVSCNGSKPQLRSLTLYPNNGDESDLYRCEIGTIMALPETTRNGDGVTVESSSTQRDFALLCWVDDQGNEYLPESNFKFTSENVDLYAVWELNVCVENLYGNRTVIKSRTNGSYDVPASFLVDPSNSYLAYVDGSVCPKSGALANDDLMIFERRYEYRISFNANGGTGEMADQICQAGVTTPINDCAFNAPSAYHSFAGWNTKADGSGTALTDSSSLTGDIVLYAQWNGPATITFDANGGNGNMEPQPFQKGVAQALTANAFTFEKKLFNGWNTKADGSGTAYEDKASVSFDENATLYAQWLCIYDVTFDANGGEGSMEGLSFIEGQAQELAANTFTHESKVFYCWNTEADGSGTSYGDKAVATFTSDTTLYAQWRSICHVTFDANGGLGTMEVQNCIEGLSQKLSPNAFYATNKVFKGWNTQADGSGTAYADCADAIFHENTTLYAQWENMVSVFFRENGGTGSMSPQYFVKGVPQVLKHNTFTANKKLFDGWSTTESGLGTHYEDGAVITLTSNLILFAQWINLYEVTFHANGGTGTMEPITFTQGVSQELPPNAFVANGKVFRGWNTKADGSGAAYFDKATLFIDSDTTLYAQWSDQYVVSFDGNGVLGEMEPQYFTKNMMQYLKPNEFVSPNVNFSQWNTHFDGTGITYLEGVLYKFESDTTLYAQWECNVTFDSNGGIGTMDQQTFALGKKNVLNACDFTCAGKYFGGWNTKADGSGTSYGDKDLVSFDSHVTLYAQWLDCYSVSFLGNGGSGSMENQVFVDGIPQELALNTFTAPTDKMFGSWNTQPDGSGTSYEGGATILLTSDITLYAQWIDCAESFEIGDTGPAGGIIFYDCDADNNHGNADGLLSSECGWRYLEASRNDLQAIFGYSSSSVSTGTAIGTGKTNTENLVAAMGTAANVSNWKEGTTSDYAAYLASQHNEGGYEDWFLPSKDELNLMYVNLKSNDFGSFADDYYWSSSVKDENTAWNQVFNGGSQYDNLRGLTRNVRCIRAF